MAQLSYANYTGDGVTTQYTIPCEYLAQSHLDIKVAGVTQTLGVNYTINTGTNKVVFSVAPTNGATILVRRLTPKATASRVVDFSSGAGLTEENLDTAALAALYIEQELSDRSDQTIRGPLNDGEINDLPTKAVRASKLLGFDSSGQPQMLDNSSNVFVASSDVISTSVTLLRSMDPLVAAAAGRILLTGYYTFGDFGEPRVGRWNPLSVATDNGGTVFQITGVATGRFEFPLGDVCNIKHFGAKGDTLTNDTSAFTNAISALSGAGGVILIPSGTYLVDTITVNVGHLRFQGTDRPVIKQRTNTNYRVFFVSQGYVTFENLILDGNGSANTATNLGLIEYDLCNNGVVRYCDLVNSGADGVVLNRAPFCTVEHCYFTAISRGVSGNTQNLTPMYDTRVTDCTFTGMHTGQTYMSAIRIAATDTARQYRTMIARNSCDSAVYQGLDLYQGAFDCHVTNNTFHYSDWGISMGHHERSTVTGNSFKGNLSYGIEMAEGCIGCTVTGNVIDGRNAAGTVVMETGIAVLGGVPSGFTNAKHNVVSGNTVRYTLATASSKGLYCYQADYTTLANNVVDSCNTGIVLQDTTGTRVTGGSISTPGTTYAFIDVTQGGATHNESMSVSGVRFQGTGGYGIAFSNSSTGETRHALVTNNSTQSMIASNGGIYVATLSKVPNLRIFGNHSSDFGNKNRAFNLWRYGVGGSETITNRTPFCVADATSAPLTITLPSAVNLDGHEFEFVKVDATANLVTIQASGAELINGANTYVGLTAQYKYLRIRSNNTQWYIVASN